MRQNSLLGAFEKCTPYASKVHCWEVRSFDFMDIDQLSLAPESNFSDLVIEGVKTEVDLFSRVRMDFEL